MNSLFLLCCSVWLIYVNATNIQQLSHSELPTNLSHTNSTQHAHFSIPAHLQNPTQSCSQWNCSSYESNSNSIYTFLNIPFFFPAKRFTIRLRLHITATFRYFYFHTDSTDDLSLIRIALKLCNPIFRNCNPQFSDCLPFYAVYIENTMAVFKNLPQCCIPFSYQFYSLSSTSISKSVSFHLFFILAAIVYDNENGGVTNDHVSELLLHLLKSEICIEFFKIYCTRICHILGVDFSISQPIQYQHSLDDRLSAIVDFQVIKLVHHYKDKRNPVIAEIMTEVWNGILRIHTKPVKRMLSKFHQGLFLEQLQKMNEEIQKKDCSESDYPKCCSLCEVKNRTEFKNESKPELGNNQSSIDREMTPLDYSKSTLDKPFQSTSLINYFEALNQLIDSSYYFGILDSYLMPKYHLSWFDSITDNIEMAFEQIISELNPPNDEHTEFIEKFIIFISETLSIQVESYSKNIYSLLKRTESDDEKLSILAASLKTIRMFINFEMFCRKICDMQHHLTGDMENTARLHRIITVTFFTTFKMTVIFESMFAKLSKNEQVVEDEDEQKSFLGWNKVMERRDVNNFSECSISLTFMVDICFEECVAIKRGTSTLSEFMQKYKNNWKVLDCLQIGDVVENMTLNEQSEWLKGFVVFIMEFSD